MTTPGWDDVYLGSTPPPWDIGRPQPAFARLAGEGRLGGQVLDAGCGTGEHALLAAAHGADATGVDISPRAIGQARAKAATRGLAARFEVADLTSLDPAGPGGGPALAGGPVLAGTVLDCGLFHVFDDENRARYVRSLATVLRPGGTCYLMCFSEQTPGTFGPRRVRQDELRAAFAQGWEVAGITADAFDLNPGLPARRAQAWLATIIRR